MAQYDINLRDYWRIIRKRRSIIIFTMITMAIFSFIFARFKAKTTVDFYASSATIRIDKTISGDEFMMRSYGFSGTDEIETEIKTITSFTIMAEVARRFGTIAETDSNSAIRKDSELLSIVNNLTSFVDPERFEFTNIITINAMGYDPVEARDLAQIVAETYKDIMRIEVNKSIDNTIVYLEEELEKNTNELEATKDALMNYTAENDSLMPYFNNDAISRDMLVIYSRQNDLDAREQTIKSMLELIEEHGTIDDSSISSAFADEEGVVFRNNYTGLLRLMDEREDLIIYFTDEHPKVKVADNKISNTRKSLLDQLQGSLNHIDGLRKGFEKVSKNLRKQLIEVTKKKEELQQMELEISVKQDKHLGLISRLQIVQIKKSEDIDEVTIIIPAVLNPEPVNKATSTTSVTLIGIFLGMVIGLVFGFIFESLDTSIGTIEDVEAYLNMPVIGLIPQIELSQLKYKYAANKYSYKDGTKGQKAGTQEKDSSDDKLSGIHARLVIKHAPKSPIAESYRALRTNIQFISFEKEAKVLMFSSSSPGEGKTTTIVNLALTMAQSGNRVLLIDADMRKPKLNQIFGLDRERGLSEIILGNFQWRECIKTVTDIIIGELGMSDIVLTPGIDNLHIITCGDLPPNPSELLNSNVMDEFVNEIRAEYDMALFDCTPILPTTDPAVLGRKIDGTVIVYAVGKVSRGSLKRAKAQMDNVKARMVGIVLNGMRGDNTSDYPEYKYNEAYYGMEDDEETSAKGARKIKKIMGNFIGRFS